MPFKILIIDDEPRNILALAATLKARNYKCMTAGSAVQGIALLRDNEDIDLVLLDMMMPDLDGYQAIPEIKRQRSLPVVAVTAQAMLGDREKCLEAGADAYIPKPIDVDRLLQVLNQFLK